MTLNLRHYSSIFSVSPKSFLCLNSEQWALICQRWRCGIRITVITLHSCDWHVRFSSTAAPVNFTCHRRIKECFSLSVHWIISEVIQMKQPASLSTPLGHLSSQAWSSSSWEQRGGGASLLLPTCAAPVHLNAAALLRSAAPAATYIGSLGRAGGTNSSFLSDKLRRSR